MVHFLVRSTSIRTFSVVPLVGKQVMFDTEITVRDGKAMSAWYYLSKKALSSSGRRGETANRVAVESGAAKGDS